MKVTLNKAVFFMHWRRRQQKAYRKQHINISRKQVGFVNNAVQYFQHTIAITQPRSITIFIRRSKSRCVVKWKRKLEFGGDYDDWWNDYEISWRRCLWYKRFWPFTLISADEGKFVLKVVPGEDCIQQCRYHSRRFLLAGSRYCRQAALAIHTAENVLPSIFLQIFCALALQQMSI